MQLSTAKVGYKCLKNGCFSEEIFTPLQNLVQEVWTVNQMNPTHILILTPNSFLYLLGASYPTSPKLHFPTSKMGIQVPLTSQGYGRI